MPNFTCPNCNRRQPIVSGNWQCQCAVQKEPERKYATGDSLGPVGMGAVYFPSRTHEAQAKLGHVAGGSTYRERIEGAWYPSGFIGQDVNSDAAGADIEREALVKRVAVLEERNALMGRAYKALEDEALELLRRHNVLADKVAAATKPTAAALPDHLFKFGNFR